MAVKFIILFICLATISLSSAGKGKRPPPEQRGNSSAILLQIYHWLSSSYKDPTWYKKIEGLADDIAELGVTHIWSPPPSNSGAPEGYLPRQLNNLDSEYGSAEELKCMIKALKERGVHSVVDIVVNHRVGTADWADFTEPEWGPESICSDDEWGKGTGNPDTGTGFDGGRDLDHKNVEVVQNGIIKWMKEVLKPAGFNGIRFDFVKGFKPEYFGKYARAFHPEFCVGELWADLDLNNADAGRQKIIDWIDGTGKSCGGFDFTTKGLLNTALKEKEYWRLRDNNGKPAGMIGWWPEMSVTFVDNHDTGPAEACGSGQNLWSVPCDNVVEGYAYILTHPGIPTLYFPHVFDWGMKKSIADLIKARRAAGVTSSSKVEIQAAEQDLYSAIVIGNSKKLAMKIGPKDWSPGSDWKLETSGNNYAVWTS